MLLSAEKASQFTSVNELIELLDDHQIELSTYSKDYKLSKRDPENLSKFLDYYQSLKQQNF